MTKQSALEAAMAQIDKMVCRPGPSAHRPISDAEAAEARRYIASGRPTKLANGATVFTHGGED